MEIVSKLIHLSVCFMMASCSPLQKISDVYIDDFQTENINLCGPSDVDLNNYEAEKFFSRSREVEYKIIHDHYNVAPCHIEGVLTFNGRFCEWKIQASAIGSIKCNEEVSHYVCDSCDDLFN